MKVQCKQEDLARGLAVVSRAVSQKTTLPILQNVLLVATTTTSEATGSADSDTARGASLKLVATNLEISISLHLPAQVEQAGELTLPARLLTDFVTNLPKEGVVSLDTSGFENGQQRINIQCGGNSEANIGGIAAEDFPAITDVTTKTVSPLLSLPALLFRQAINQVAFAASDDMTRPVLSGVAFNLDVKENSLTMVSADSFMLAVKQLRLTDMGNTANLLATDSTNIILPARAMEELARILPSEAEELVEISLTTNKSKAIFRTSEFVFTTSLIEGNFPNYKQIVPKSYTTRAIVATTDLIRAAKVALLFARDNGNNIVRMEVYPTEGLTPGHMQLQSNNAEYGSNRGEVAAVDVEGTANQVAFNAKFLLEMLGAIETEQVALEIQTPTMPGVLKPVGKDDFVSVVMPMHISSPSR